MNKSVLVISAFLFLAGCRQPQPLESSNPSKPFDESALSQIRTLMNVAIEEKKMPGAVFWLESDSGTFAEAFGSKTLEPEIERMELDSVFDVASLTKVIATTPSILILMEQGNLRLDQPLSELLPESNGGSVTVRHLLTHTSGFRPGLRSSTNWTGYEQGIRYALMEKPIQPPGATIVYSDINYILLGEIVRRQSGKPLHEFAREKIFQPLKMRDTRFAHARISGPRTVPTEKVAGQILRGEVHDPTARKFGGAAGHAGLFSTASDLARFCRMMLNGGSLDGVRILSRTSIQQMTSVQTPANVWGRRGLGWDIDTDYSSPRGNRFPLGSFGHTGYTGCALWIDPYSRTFFVFLSNRLHPNGEGNTLGLNRPLSTLAAQATGFDFGNVTAMAPQKISVLNGIDVLVAEKFSRLKGLKIGLVSNHTGRDKAGNHLIDLMLQNGLDLKCLFSPEHGIRGTLDEKIGDSIDEKTGLPIYSLYGERRMPSADQLKELDALVFDIQDIGCRFYTYISTMANCLEACGKSKKKFVVLDRINPINGYFSEGPNYLGAPMFTACHPLPIRHGMTVGELAKMFNVEKQIGADLEVIQVRGWDRRIYLDQTDLPWRNTSPNMRSLEAAILYPGVGLLETSSVSVGRGTETPFDWFGAPYIDADRLKAEFDALSYPGVEAKAISFTPNASKHKGVLCHGLKFKITRRDQFNAAGLGITLASILHRLYPGEFALKSFNTHLQDSRTIEALENGKPLKDIFSLWEIDEKEFNKRRQRFLLY
jgi:uncharacterized protein YbbC (DUF1343 family)/CubicO group peptidase (beta-lactamase class C family)